MTEERVCKSCGRPVDYLEYKEGNGKCYQCQPGYGGHSFTEGSEEWRASPKPKKPLAERLDSLSDKIISAKAMFQVAMEAEQEVTALKKELQQ